VEWSGATEKNPKGAKVMKSKHWVMCAMMLAGMVTLQGCVLFVVGVAAGAGAGAVSYVGNELRVTQEVSLDRAWEAAHGAMQDLQYSVISDESHKDAAGAALMARNSKDQPVRVQLVRQSDSLTEIRIRVGTFTTSENGAAAKLVYDKIRDRL
jgi:hypothetical protein